jgi:DNA ligase-associated metallophosphoesterase
LCAANGGTRNRLASRTVSLPLAFPDALPPAQRHALVVDAGGERVELLAARALFWIRERTLFVADVHLGKAATFRAAGIPLPRGTTASDLARLAAVVQRTGAKRVVVLGDLLHARAGRVAALTEAFVAWRDAHPLLDVMLVRGNHDARAGDPPASWNVRCVDEPFALAPFLACHRLASPPSGYALCGHVHPGVRLNGGGEQTARLPCFVLGARHAILPAFGRFTGLADIAPVAGERVVAIAGASLFPLPPARPMTLS